MEAFAAEVFSRASLAHAISGAARSRPQRWRRTPCGARLAVAIAGGTARAVLGALPRAPLTLPDTCKVLQDASSWTPETALALGRSVTSDLEAAELQLTPYEMALHSTALIRAAREALEK